MPPRTGETCSESRSLDSIYVKDGAAQGGNGSFLHPYRTVTEAAECSIAKMFCSEVLDRTVDEILQIHGGYAYVSDYPAERYYRDARIHRIWEGTNEINRLRIPGIILRTRP